MALPEEIKNYSLTQLATHAGLRMNGKRKCPLFHAYLVPWPELQKLQRGKPQVEQLTALGRYLLKTPPNRVTEDLFDTTPPQKAWEACCIAAMLTEDETKLVTMAATLETMGKKLRHTTRERARQILQNGTRKLRTSPEVIAALKHYLRTNEITWLEIETQRRSSSNYLPPLDAWATITIRVFHHSTTNWLKTHGMTLATAWKKAPDESFLRKIKITAKTFQEPIFQTRELAARLGCDENELEQPIPGLFRRQQYTGNRSIRTHHIAAIALAEQYAGQIMAGRKEMLLASGFSDIQFDRIMQKSGAIWNAGNWVIIPPKKDPQPEQTQAVIPKGTLRGKQELDMLEVLDLQPFWKTIQVQKKLNQDIGPGVGMYLQNLRETRRLAPGLITTREELTREETQHARNALLYPAALKSYLLSKESGSKLSNFPLWDFEMEYQWAKWLITQPGPVYQRLLYRLSKTVQTQHWPIAQVEIWQWNKVFQQVEPGTQPRHKPKLTSHKAKDDELANIAAVILHTGGISTSDINIILGNLPGQKNKGIIQQLENLRLVEPGKGHQWRPMIPAAKPKLVKLLQDEAARRWNLPSSI